MMTGDEPGTLPPAAEDSKRLAYPSAAVSEAATRVLRNFAKIMASMMEARPGGFASRN